MPVAKIIHELPWRVRLRAPDLVGHASVCERIAARLAAESSADRVRVQPSTGSVLFEATEHSLDAKALCAKLERLVLEEHDDDGRPIVSHEHHPGPTRVARAVAHSFFRINEGVRHALDDRADLASLLPVFFAAGGVTEVLKSKKLPAPPWFNLLWWSVRSFMTFNVEAVEEERRNGNEKAANANGGGVVEGNGAMETQ